MSSAESGGPLSDAELREMARLLARFADYHLDQWENWRIHAYYGPVYVAVSRALLSGWPEEAFTTIWPLPPHLTETGPSTGDGLE